MEKLEGIKVTKEVKEKLNDLKVHPRQAYSEVIDILIKSYNQSERRCKNE